MELKGFSKFAVENRNRLKIENPLLSNLEITKLLKALWDQQKPVQQAQQPVQQNKFLEMDGDLLTLKLKPHEFIMHQVNAKGGRSMGLSKELFAIYPSANVYKNKVQLQVGEVNISTPIINLVGQRNPGKANKTDDTTEMRLAWFKQGLESLKQLKHDIIFVPKFIGCGLAGGNWNDYYKLLENSGLNIVMVNYVPNLEVQQEQSQEQPQEQIPEAPHVEVEHWIRLEGKMKRLMKDCKPNPPYRWTKANKAQGIAQGYCEELVGHIQPQQVQQEVQQEVPQEQRWTRLEGKMSKLMKDCKPNPPYRWTSANKAKGIQKGYCEELH